jgi:hypothetical protein
MLVDQSSTPRTGRHEPLSRPPTRHGKFDPPLTLGANGIYGTPKGSPHEAEQGLSGRKPAKKRQPQERQHSAASWRDAGPTVVARPV